jgi:hypothetical protein
MTKAEKSDIIKLVSQGDLKEAISKMITSDISEEKLQEAVVISSRYERIKREQRMDTVYHEEKNTELNKIVDGLMGLINSLPISDESPSDPSKDKASQGQPPVQITNSKNVVTGKIKAGGNVIIGDNNNNNG